LLPVNTIFVFYKFSIDITMPLYSIKRNYITTIEKCNLAIKFFAHRKYPINIIMHKTPAYEI
ncbi:hypothetical protein, partial [Streptococcus agalactiae]|uniref:hypothetical protein n=1 Tax=Streptococcus agalactiae TaxID=1311 RepID=UPI001CBF672A